MSTTGIVTVTNLSKRYGLYGGKRYFLRPGAACGLFYRPCRNQLGSRADGSVPDCRDLHAIGAGDRCFCKGSI